MTSTPTVHKIAQLGYGAGTNELYDRARPSYQAPVLAHVRQAVASTDPLNIVEIGSGTGIFTRALLAHPNWQSSVGNIRAVEPSEGMREIFNAKISDPRVSVVDGTFDATGIEDGWADIIVIAQAFHWCPNFDTAAREFARILKRNGVVALVWNNENPEAATWIVQAQARTALHENGAPQSRHEVWRSAFDTPSYKALFESPIEKVWEYVLPSSREIYTDRVLSKSYVTQLSTGDKTKLAEDVGAIIDRGDKLVWIDKSKGIFEHPYKSRVVLAKKKTTGIASQY